MPLIGQFPEWWKSLQSMNPLLLPYDLHKGACCCATFTGCACGALVLGIAKVACEEPLAIICKKKLLKRIRFKAKGLQCGTGICSFSRVKGFGDRTPKSEKTEVLKSWDLTGFPQRSGAKREAPRVSITFSNSGPSRRKTVWQKGLQTKLDNQRVATAEAKTREPREVLEYLPGAGGAQKIGRAR